MLERVGRRNERTRTLPLSLSLPPTHTEHTMSVFSRSPERATAEPPCLSLSPAGLGSTLPRLSQLLQLHHLVNLSTQLYHVNLLHLHVNHNHSSNSIDLLHLLTALTNLKQREVEQVVTPSWRLPRPVMLSVTVSC